jgi:hypothetical protein
MVLFHSSAQLPHCRVSYHCPIGAPLATGREDLSHFHSLIGLGIRQRANDDQSGKNGIAVMLDYATLPK